MLSRRTAYLVPSFRDPRQKRGFSCFWGAILTYVAYIDEFGHIGPYVSRSSAKYNESPVFGLAGYVLPIERVRDFGTWFYQRKCELLDWEIRRSGQPAYLWEKKGAALYTIANVTQYAELRQFTNRFLNKIRTCGGFTFYVGTVKRLPPGKHNANYLYLRMLVEAIKRVNRHCDAAVPPQRFILNLDEHSQRENLITAAAQVMYRANDPYRRLIEPPFSLESHRYQTIQAADWIAGLVGRVTAHAADPVAYADHKIFADYFGGRLDVASHRSGIRY